MSFFEKVIFIISKPLVLYMFSPILFYSIGEWEVVAKLVAIGVFFTLIVAILAIEYITMSKKQIYEPVRDVDEAKVIEIAGRYLNRDYRNVQVHRRSLRGSFYRKGFEEQFHIQVRNRKFIVTIYGSFPFPISLLNRIKISSDIEAELNSHGVFRA